MPEGDPGRWGCVPHQSPITLMFLLFLLHSKLFLIFPGTCNPGPPSSAVVFGGRMFVSPTHKHPYQHILFHFYPPFPPQPKRNPASSARPMNGQVIFRRQEEPITCTPSSSHFVPDHFSGAGRAVGPMCVCVCVCPDKNFRTK